MRGTAARASEAHASRTIPHVLSFTYKVDLLRAPDASLTALERVLARNVRSTIHHHHRPIGDLWFGGDPVVHFYDDEKCVQVIRAAFPPLLPFFQNEVSGMYKGDICRGAALYQHGGLYFDVDMVARMNSSALIGRDTEFVTCISNSDRVESLRWNVKFFQSFIAVAPRHGIMWRYLEALLQMYNAAVDTFGSISDYFKPQVASRRSHDMGTIAMKRGYDVWLHEGGDGRCGDSSNVSIARRRHSVQLWEERPLSTLTGRRRVPRQAGAKHVRRCELVVFDPVSGQAPFYSRVPGTELCPYSRTNKSSRAPMGPGRRLSAGATDGYVAQRQRRSRSGGGRGQRTQGTDK